jgi:hypothetical protein
MMRMVEDFNRNRLDLKRLNFGVITLVPKAREANIIKKYIPICLLNVDFMVFLKLLNDMLTPLADNIVSGSQTAFIKGKNILEGVIPLHKVLHELKQTKKQGVLFKIDFENAYDKVKCDFVREVMERKGFPPNWTDLVICMIQGGKVCVYVNGERSQYFRTFQGLRQGDPLSTILFNLVANVLGALMRKAAKKNKIKGLMSHLIEEGITHIQYADDTILMIEGDDRSIVNMKFILYCFEWISGLRINYHKSEAYVFGMDDEGQARIANMLKCQLGALPMIYLGILVSDKKLDKGAFLGVTENIAKRVPP